MDRGASERGPLDVGTSPDDDDSFRGTVALKERRERGLLYAPAVADASFATPAEAAEAGFSDIPSKYVRVETVSYSDDGGSAVVTVLTNEALPLPDVRALRSGRLRALDRDV
jgi:hypothetical protein